MKRPLLITTLIILGGLLLSILVLIAMDPICDRMQTNGVRRLCGEHVEKVAQDLESTLALVSDFARKLPQDEELTAERFEELAKRLLTHPRINTVEWAPIVQPNERDEIESKIAARMGRKIEVMTYREGYTIRVPNSEVCHPALFVEPRNEKTDERIGYQRGRWAAYSFSLREPGQSFTTIPHLWYSDDPPRVAVFATSSNAEETQPRGTVFVTLNEAFSATSCDREQSTVKVVDLTTPDYSMGENVGDRELFQVESTNAKYVARQQLGGRLYEFEAKTKSDYILRPIWLPWSCFFLTNLVACVLSLALHQRESKTLKQHNGLLQKEIERRVAVEGHLLSTLDFREQERELVAHDIHDGFVQDVIGAQMFIESALADVDVANHPVREKLGTVANLLGQAIGEARRTIDYLKPKVVDEVGLVEALEVASDEDERNYGFRTRLHLCPEIPRLPVLAERIVFRIAREALCNVRQHSGVMDADLNLTLDGDMLRLEVADLGAGFDPDRIDADRFGLTGMRQRAEVLNGEMRVHTSEFGTKIEVEIPADQAETQELALPDNRSLLLESSRAV